MARVFWGREKKKRPEKVDIDEKELWPNLAWKLSALLSAGLSPAAVFSRLVKDFQLQEPEIPSDPIERLRSAGRRHSLQAAQQDIALILQVAAVASAQGLPLARALMGLELSRDYSHSRLAELAACWQISERTGAPLAEVLENLARFYESEIDLSQARESAMSGPTSTGQILSWLPLLGLGLGILMGTDPLGLIFGSVLGAFIGILGLGLALAGRRWTAKLVRAAEEGRL